MRKIKAYDAHYNGELVATGTIIQLADVLNLSKGTVYNIVNKGHEYYRIEPIGTYEKVYALYAHDDYVYTGAVIELSKLIDSTENGLYQTQYRASGYKYRVYKLEGEFTVVRKKEEQTNFVERIFELNIQGVIHTGTVKEIVKCAGVKANYVYQNAVLLGKRYAEIRLTNRGDGETHFTTMENIEKDFDVPRNTAISALHYSDGVTKRYIVELTGRHIMDYVKNDRHGVVKPKSGYTTIKPLYSKKVTPMSDYGKELFEWSTRHLRSGTND